MTKMKQRPNLTYIQNSLQEEKERQQVPGQKSQKWFACVDIGIAGKQCGHIFWRRIAYSLEMQLPSTGHLYAKKRLDDLKG